MRLHGVLHNSIELSSARTQEHYSIAAGGNGSKVASYCFDRRRRRRCVVCLCLFVLLARIHQRRSRAVVMIVGIMVAAAYAPSRWGAGITQIVV